MTDHEVDTTTTGLQPGDTIDVVIKGVRFAYGHNNEHNPGRFSISADDGRRYTMPPQAAITRPGENSDDRVADVLSLLDSMETEGGLQPYVAAAVRTKLGLPPRHWPPRPGDIWDDGFPFGGSLWFARQYKAADDNVDWPSRIVMTCVEGGTAIKSPQDFLGYAVELKLVYRHKDGGR